MNNETQTRLGQTDPAAPIAEKHGVNDMVNSEVPTIESILQNHGLRVTLSPDDFQLLELDLLRFMINMVAVQKAHNDLMARDVRRVRAEKQKYQTLYLDSKNTKVANNEQDTDRPKNQQGAFYE